MATAQERINQLKRRKVRPSGPGEIAAGLIEEMELTKTEFAARLGVSRVQISQLLNGHSALSPDMAHRFGRFFGNGASFWLRLQHTLDMWDLLHKDTAKYQEITPMQKAA